MEDQIHCPKCNSTQITANKKGFSGAKATVGVVLTGGIGLLAGTIGSKKIIITCLACGNQFKPGQANKTIIEKPIYNTLQYSAKEKSENNQDAAKKLWPLAFIIGIVCLCFQWWIIGSISCILALCWFLIAKRKSIN